MLREETAAIAPRFDAADYLLYIRRRWAVVAVACGAAGALALIASLLMPNRYTATASVLIEPPAGTDPRAFTAVSPVYLESLRTYERLASSDSLFLRALEKFHMFDPSGGRPVEVLKRRILSVSKVRDTKVLEIGVTLRDPKEAQAMAQFVAEETVKLSAAATREAGQDLIKDTRRQRDDARADVEQARGAWAKLIAAEPVETLREEINSLVELQQRMRRNIAEAQASAAEFETRAKAAQAGGEPRRDAEFYAAEGSSHRARSRELEAALRDIERAIGEKDRLLGVRIGRLDAAEEQLTIALDRYDAAAARAENLTSSVGLGGERLRVVDPGIVPQRPSEPRTALNLIVAIGVAFLASMVYLTLSFNLRR
ncbi:MAG: hypothetical protein KIT09_06995 [Bryobacteraceae bacterium]|nr:hypothetical protein [Bryobacteraceae bacterium]